MYSAYGIVKHVRGSDALRSNGTATIMGQGSGIVTKATAPAREKVLLHIKLPIGSRLIDWVQASASGEYLFDQLDPNRRYVVMAFDHQLQFNAVIRDNITPAVDE